jgi:hypothetical protein
VQSLLLFCCYCKLEAFYCLSSRCPQVRNMLKRLLYPVQKVFSYIPNPKFTEQDRSQFLCDFYEFFFIVQKHIKAVTADINTRHLLY